MTDLNNEPIENIVRLFMESGGFAVADLIVANGYRFTPDELKIIMKKEYLPKYTYARVLAQQKYFFTVDELINYGDPSGGEINTIAWHMICNGYDGFTVDDIIALHDLLKNDREYIAIFMAQRGHYFTLDEIIRLNNPADPYKITLAHLMAHHCEFYVDELLLLGNPADKDGDTIAHMMAKAGHKFSNDELLKLDLKFTLKPQSIYLDIKNGGRFDDGFYGGGYSELFVNGQLCYSDEFSHTGADITIFNREAFSVFENYAFSIRHDFDEKKVLQYKYIPVRINGQPTLLTDTLTAVMMVHARLFDEKERGSHFPDIGYG